MGNSSSSEASSYEQYLLDSFSIWWYTFILYKFFSLFSSNDEHSNETFSTDSDSEVSEQSNERLRIENDHLKVKCEEMSEQLVEKTRLVEQLQAARNEENVQTKTAFDLLKSLGMDVPNSRELYDALWNCYCVCYSQKQYSIALVHLEKIIQLEKSTQNRSMELVRALNDKAYCYLALKQYEQAIDAATSALQYNSDYKRPWLNRAYAYFELKQYSNARHDLEKLLQLHPDYQKAKILLERVQKCIDESNFK